MILVGNPRGGGRDLAQHLMKTENERVEVAQLHGFIAGDLDGAFRETYAISRGTRCQQYLFSMSLNPPKDAAVDDECHFRHGLFQPVDKRIVERRDVPVLLRRQALQPCLARVDRDPPDARLPDRLQKAGQHLARLLLVDADPALDGDLGPGRRRDHRRRALRHEVGRAHQGRVHALGMGFGMFGKEPIDIGAVFGVDGHAELRPCACDTKGDSCFWAQAPHPAEMVGQIGKDRPESRTDFGPCDLRLRPGQQ